MALFTYAELARFRPLHDPDALLRVYLERWAEHLGARLDFEEALRRAVHACFGTYIYNQWLHSRSAGLSLGPDCIVTRLSLLQMGVVPEVPFGSDPEVVAARSAHAEPSETIVNCVVYELERAFERYLQLTAAQAKLRVGGSAIVGARLRTLPEVMVPALNSQHDAEAWVWLYHFGVTDVRPPDFDSSELWDSLPDEIKK